MLDQRQSQSGVIADIYVTDAEESFVQERDTKCSR